MSSGLDQFGELTPERREELIEWIAQQVVKRGLGTAAVMMIEVNRPLSFLYSQSVHFVSPALDELLGKRQGTQVARLLEDRKNLQRLIDRIEELEEEAAEKQKKLARERRELLQARRQAEAIEGRAPVWRRVWHWIRRS